MRKNMALRLSGFLFLLMAVLHALRLYYKVEIVVSGHPLSMRVSLVGVIITLLLSIWMFAASRARK